MDFESKMKLAVEMANFCLQEDPRWKNSLLDARKEQYQDCLRQMFDLIGDFKPSRPPAVGSANRK